MIANGGNQCRAADQMGMHRNTLSRLMNDVGLTVAECRAEVPRKPPARARLEDRRQERLFG